MTPTPRTTRPTGSRADQAEVLEAALAVMRARLFDDDVTAHEEATR